MKMITLMVTLLFCVPSFAGQYRAVGADGANTNYSKLSDCEAAESSKNNYSGCYDIRGKDLRYWEVQTIQVDDYSQPQWKAEYNVEACQITDANASDYCYTMAESKTDCTNEPEDTHRIRENTLMPDHSIVCTRLLGYAQMDKAVLVENTTLKASVQAADAAAASQQTALDAAKAARSFGETIVDTIAVKNVSKGLSEGQIKQVIQDYELVMQMLMAGAIATARDEVAAMVPDGTRITQADKDEILAALDAYLGQ